MAVPTSPTIIQNIEAKVINPIVGLMFTVALMYFIYGVFELFIANKNGSAVEQGRQHVMYGVLGFAIMVSVWGIIRFICTSVGLVCN